MPCIEILLKNCHGLALFVAAHPFQLPHDIFRHPCYTLYETNFHQAQVRSMDIVSEPSWHWMLEEVLDLRGVIFLLGMTNSGKSTLARHLIRELTVRRLTTALVDTDIGQSTLGSQAPSA
jgi:polynucleotide 5'-kinase involved in rRNA processing